MRRRKLAAGDARWFPRPTDITTAKLLEAMEQDTCPICYLVGESQNGFLFSLLWEGVTDPFVRIRLRQSYGFCYRHTVALRRAAAEPWGGQLGVAILYRDLVDMTLTSLTRPAQGWLRRLVPSGDSHVWLRPSRPCWLCETTEGAERDYLHGLKTGVDESAWFRAHYSHSHGLCLEHARQAVETTCSPRGKRLLWACARANASQLLDHSPSSPSALWAFLHAVKHASVPDGLKHEGTQPCPGCTAAREAEQALAAELSANSALLLWADLCSTHRALVSQELLRRSNGDRELAYGLTQAALAWLQGTRPKTVCWLCQESGKAARLLLLDGEHDVSQLSCIVHIRMTLRHISPAQRRLCLDSLSVRLSRLSDELGELIRKHDYRFAAEPAGSERDAWLRALEFFSGDRTMGRETGAR